MALRASAEIGSQSVDLRSVTDRTIDPGIAGGAELVDLVDAVLLRGDAAAARTAVLDALGSEALVDAAGVIGNFQMMNRVAEGTGMPVGSGSLARTEALRSRLGLDRFRHRPGPPAAR